MPEIKHQRALIVIPTYNEVENIVELIQAILAVRSDDEIHILVVDSNSPDGTGARLETLKEEIPQLHVLHQPRKLGLGRAYLDAFQYFPDHIPHTYDLIVTMDADFSHHPRYLPIMLEKMRNFDVVIGSRYVAGGRLENWPRRRKLLSHFANTYAKILTGIPLNDLTSGFHCFRVTALEKILSHPISAEGYAFLIELKVRASTEHFKILEIPIIFADRTKGDSKISKRVIWESACVVLRIFLQRALMHRRQ